MPSTREKLAKKKSKLAKPRERFEEHPANLNNFQEGSFYNIEVDLINPNPAQPRKFFDPDSLEELSHSIKKKGVLQPVIIRRDQDEKIYLVAGERRLRAAKMAGLEKIPAILTKGNPMEISLIENLQRDNLKPIEEAEALGRMMEEYQYTQEQLALAIGKGRTTITETLSLNKLPEEIKEECRHADIYPRRLLVEVAKQKTPKAMISLFSQIKEGNLKSDQVREASRKHLKRASRTPAAIALEKTLGLVSYLNKIDLKALDENEKVQLLTELAGLKKSIEDLLS
jgi:ParB family chromosome partitioning protein